MNLQNIQPRQMVRSRHIDQPVKPSWTKNRRINNVRPVRRTNNNNIDQRLYPVQLRQQLANHPLRDAAIAKTHAPPRNHRVELVEEHDRRSSSPPLTKHLRSEEHTSELQSRSDLVCRLLLEKKKKKKNK